MMGRPAISSEVGYLSFAQVDNRQNVPIDLRIIALKKEGDARLEYCQINYTPEANHLIHWKFLQFRSLNCQMKPRWSHVQTMTEVREQCFDV